MTRTTCVGVCLLVVQAAYLYKHAVPCTSYALLGACNYFWVDLLVNLDKLEIFLKVRQ